jgi:hypothetical protein
VLLRDAYSPERWYWFLSGLTHPDDEDFRWQGEATSEVEAFVALSTCWQQWTRWAGLEPIATLSVIGVRPTAPRACGDGRERTRVIAAGVMLGRKCRVVQSPHPPYGAAKRRPNRPGSPP